MPPRSKRRRRLLRFVLLGVVLPGTVVAAAVFVYLYVEVTLKFEGRLWTEPSRVYGDLLTVVPGTAIGADAVAARLDRQGYQRVPADPAAAGQYRRSGGLLDVHLRSFEGGDRKLPARRARLRFAADRVSSLEDVGGRRLDHLVFEPELLTLVFGPQQEERRVVRLPQVPEGFVHAVLAAEDARFYSHPGFDPVGIARAAFANLRSGKVVQGGSTITQQTVKNLYLGQERTFARKLRELAMAVILDLRYSKDRILEAYLNEVYLGQRGPVAICGVETASQFYFGRDLGDLSPGEWALIAGLIRSPGGVNPFVHPEKAIERRNQVLSAMEEHGWIEPDAAKRAKAEPLRLASGGAGYGRAPYAVDLARVQLGESYTAQQLSEDGLEIFTTIDTTLQEAVERAVRRGLDRLERDVPRVRREARRRRLQAAAIVIEPESGSILAMTGGRDYRDSQFNRAVQARRQPGSCFKPIVYLAGLVRAHEEGEGVTAATVLEDEPFEMESGGKPWSPQNYDGEFLGEVSAREALVESRNVPTVHAAERAGLENVVATAHALGITSELKPLPAIALGAQEVTPLELARAYATLANRGVRLSPTVVREVVAQGGRKLDRPALSPERAASPQDVFVLTDMMEDVLRRGTAASASSWGFTRVAAGKTGTTDDTRDAWFVGFTPDLLALVWVGYDDGSRTGLTGATGALPIWVDIMNAGAYRDRSYGFPEPPGIVHVDVDPTTGEAAVSGCPDRVEEIFAAGTEPERCSKHEGGFRNWLRRLFGRGSD